MIAYYNEIDPAAAHVLRHLIDDGVIAHGDVDTRSIKDVQPDDLRGYTQCHFFAGGGLWSVAARLAGWPDERPLWTGSCPCQPFSAAGKGLGTDDPRHLWPDFHRLIRAGRPAVVMGEQVAGAAGYGWFDGVGADLAGEGYASRAVDFPACSIDAPHQRNRLYWLAVAVSECSREGRWGLLGPGEGARSDREWASGQSARSDVGSGVDQVDGYSPRLEIGSISEVRGRDLRHEGTPLSATDDRSHVDDRIGGRPGGEGEPLRSGRQPAHDADDQVLHADTDGSGCAGRQEDAERFEEWRTAAERDLPRRNGTYWSDAEWIVCHDGKARRAKPGLRLLVDGLPGRVDLWRIGGNAIVPEAAAEVIRAFLDIENVDKS